VLHTRDLKPQVDEGFPTFLGIGGLTLTGVYLHEAYRITRGQQLVVEVSWIGLETSRSWLTSIAGSFSFQRSN